MSLARTLALAFAMTLPVKVLAADDSALAIAHVKTRFTFTVNAPFARVVTLFGPQSEKAWAGAHWDPKFLYPTPAADVEGAVFAVAHGASQSIWVNTDYDLNNGVIKYVSFVPEVLVTVVDVRVVEESRAQTRVAVTYTRTALRPDTNPDVLALAARDAVSKDEWSSAIATALGVAP